MSLRVVQIISDLGLGGAEKLLVTTAEQAKAYSLDLTIISLGASNDQIILDELNKNGATVHFFPANHLLDLRRIFHLTHFLRIGDFDLVQCHLEHANIIGALCGRLSGLPVVATMHSTRRGSWRFSSAMEFLEIWCMRLFAKRIMAVAYRIADNYQVRLRGKPIDVIPNAVSVPEEISKDERTRLRQEIAGDASRPIVISVGRLSPPKGYEDLVTAFSFLTSTYPKVLLIIVGEGPLFEKIRAQIKELDLEKNIVLLGIRQDVPRLLASSDIYVSSSHWEGLPLTILEAMMTALPIVATSVGDVPRLVTPEVGFLLHPHQPQLLAESIEKLLDDPKMRKQMGATARAQVMQNYSPQVRMERILSLYQKVLPRKAAEIELLKRSS